MKKVLITGYTGFIGSNLTEKLSGEILYGVDILKKDSVSRHFQWESIQECTDSEYIIHLAGKAHDTKNTSSEKEYFEINVGLTKKIFHHFLKSQAEKFIFFSSVKAVTDSVIGEILTEDVHPDPKTSYGRSKLEAEKFILTELENWKRSEISGGRDSERKKVFILRPCMIHGPGNKGNLNLLFNMQQKGLPWPLGAFNNRRSFCSIDNIIFAVQQIINKDIDPGTYQVADDEALSTNELIELIAISQNRNVRIWKIPVRFIKFTARMGDLFRLPLNSERLLKLTESYVVSNEKIKSALSVKQMPVTAVNGIQNTLNSFRKSTNISM